MTGLATVEGAATLTVTLYAVTEMEYPQLGLISRIENFDHFLIDAHQQMQTRDVSARDRSGR